LSSLQQILEPITLKALDTGQVIYPADRNYCQITPLDPETCRISYRCSHSDTRINLLVRRIDPKKLSITVESYLASPLFKTKCNLYLDGGLVIEDLGANLGKTLVCTAPPKPQPPGRVVREGVLRRIVHVDTFGVQCGIATYLENLIDPIIPLKKEIEHVLFAEEIPPGDTRASTGKDYRGNQPTLLRNWTRRQPPDRLLKDLQEYDPDILHIQHEWAFFGPYDPGLPRILQYTKQRGAANIITWHTVFAQDEMDAAISRRFFNAVKPFTDIHIVHDVNSHSNLLRYDVNPARVRLLPMSAYPVRNIPQDEARRKLLPEKYWEKKILITGGFLLPNKGVEKIILAMSAIPGKDLALICIGGSHPWSERVYRDYRSLVLETAKQTGVDLHLDYRFMDDEEIAWYMACADITILYYGRTLSGTSGWSRRAISSKRPIICTDVKLMSDLQEGVHCLKVPPGNIARLSAAIRTLLGDKALGEKLAENAARYAEEISHENTAKKLLELYEEVYEECRS